MTEDMIREQEEMFENLGSSEDAAKIRAQIQSAHLKSGKSFHRTLVNKETCIYVFKKKKNLKTFFNLHLDMQAFKAANPHAVLEDFVRWHSPRDWIVDENGDPNKGTLSPRMKEKGNLWQELWKVIILVMF